MSVELRVDKLAGVMNKDLSYNVSLGLVREVLFETLPQYKETIESMKVCKIDETRVFNMTAQQADTLLTLCESIVEAMALYGDEPLEFGQIEEILKQRDALYAEHKELIETLDAEILDLIHMMGLDTVADSMDTLRYHYESMIIFYNKYIVKRCDA